MSFFVTLTFDLNDAKPAIYPKIHADLEGIDLAKALYVRSKKRVRLLGEFIRPKKKVRLPANTFVAKITRDDLKKSKEITDYVSSEVSKIFRRHNVSGRYFVVTGDEWHWRAGRAG